MLVGVVTVTVMRESVSLKVPAKRSCGSVLVNIVVRVTALQVIVIELIFALTGGVPNGRDWSMLFGTVKASKTATFRMESDASPSLNSKSIAPSGIAVAHITPLREMPGSYECGPNGLAAARLSSQINANAPWWVLPSVPTNSPVMNRVSVWKP